MSLALGRCVCWDVMLRRWRAWPARLSRTSTQNVLAAFGAFRCDHIFLCRRASCTVSIKLRAGHQSHINSSTPALPLPPGREKERERMVLLQERREKEESKNAPPCALSTTGRIVWLGLQPGRDPHGFSGTLTTHFTEFEYAQMWFLYQTGSGF